MNDAIRCPECGSDEIWISEAGLDGYADCDCENCGHVFLVYIGNNDDLEDALDADDFQFWG